MVKLTWTAKNDSIAINSLTGIINDKVWTGTGYSNKGSLVNWNMMYTSAYLEKPDTSRHKGGKKDSVSMATAKVMYPFNGYGWTEAPKQEDILIKNATVWTNENDGKLENTDVLIKSGKISAIGKK